MAHIEKYARGAVGRMTAHYLRQPDDGVHRSNPEIHPELTHLNYNLAASEQPIAPVEFIRKRLAEVPHAKRKDLVVMCDCVVTIPQELLKKDWFMFETDMDVEIRREKFFVETYRFLSDRYGQENVISAAVHMDETTPHMHFAFVPVVKDAKGERISAKERINRTELRTLHTDLQEYLERKMNREVPILNNATRNGNKAIKELKRESAAEKLIELQELTEKTQNQAHKIIEEAHLKVQAIKNTNEGIKAELEANTAALNQIRERAERFKIAAEVLEEEKEELEENLMAMKTELEGVKVQLENARTEIAVAQKIKLEAEQAIDQRDQALEEYNQIIHSRAHRVSQELKELREKVNLFQVFLEKMPVDVRRRWAEFLQKNQKKPQNRLIR